MAEEIDTKLFAQAYRSLIFMGIEDGEDPCEAALQEHLKEIRESLVWLREIPGEVMTKFATKSIKFSQLPKTPSVKAKAQKRTRAKVETIQEHDENLSPELHPKQLNFDEESSSSPTELPSRPVRNCRKKKSSNVEEKRPLRTTRQSRKAALKKTYDVPENSSIPEEPAPIPERSRAAPVKDSSKSVDLGLNNAASPVPLSASKTNQDSPSVKERANAYETMLKSKQGQSLSPLKTKRVLTPNAASPNFTAATISSQAKASPSHHSASKTGKAKSRSSRRSSRRLSRRSLRRSSTAHGKKKTPSKPLRSKLRLKKQKATMDDKENEVVVKADQPVSDVSDTEPRDEKKGSPGKKVTGFADTQSDEEMEQQQTAAPTDRGVNETQVVVTEVFELYNNGKGAALKELEVIKTKTTSMGKKCVPTETTTVAIHRCSSDQGFDEGDNEHSSDSSPSDTNLNSTFTKTQQPEVVQGASTRTRTKKVHADTKPSAVLPEDSTVPDQAQRAPSPKESPPNCERATRTRTRALKAKEDGQKEKETTAPEVARSTRTRQRKAEEEARAAEKAMRDVNVIKAAAPVVAITPEPASYRSTRSKMRKIEPPTVDGKNEEVISGSPAIKSPTAMRLKQKRAVGERGNSPRPKRSRSCLEEPSYLESVPMSTSSPVGHSETKDTLNNSIVTPLCQSSRPYLFKSAQKKTNGFLNRTPGFANNTKVLTFFGSAPSHRNNGTFTSFLKRNTPPPKPTLKELQEQKKQRLIEKDMKDKERLKRAAEVKRQKLEEQKRNRDERLKKVAESREMREKRAQELKEEMKRKFEDKATLKERMMEEKMRAETEKQKLRMRKQIEADARRRQEEEDRLRKRLEQEEDARRQNELMHRKKEYEESERKRQIAEERKRQEERIAEKEQREIEEMARLKKIEEEKERERERAKRERERAFAQEKADRERIEREKREERDRKLKEEMERLKAMEKLRLKKQEEELKQRQANQAKMQEIQKLISQHNQQVKATGPMNTTQTLHKAGTMNTSINGSNSYQITPAVKKVYKPSDNPDDYGLNDKDSDESTDDESAPKKKIPSWASWSQLEAALIKQFSRPPDIEAIFNTKAIEPLDLVKVFPQSRMRHNFNKRTSSAVWCSPPVKSRPQF